MVKIKNRRRSRGIMYRSGMFFLIYIFFLHRVDDQWGDAETAKEAAEL